MPCIFQNYILPRLMRTHQKILLSLVNLHVLKIPESRIHISCVYIYIYIYMNCTHGLATTFNKKNLVSIIRGESLLVSTILNKYVAKK